MVARLIKIKAKEIFAKTKLPGCDWVINQYVGCEHSCLYCYAKFISRWRPPDYGRWGGWVEVKVNASELVKGRYVKGFIYMSSISDPYPSAERKLKLTRRILENLDKRTKLAIQTKSDLVLRDLDIFKKFKNIEVGLTINSFAGKTKRIFEPFSPPNKRRIKALEILKQNKVKTFAFVSPIIPRLIDLKEIIQKTKQFADYYWFEFINTRGAGKEFMEALKREYPESYEVLINRNKFQEFIKESKKIISLENIKIQGIEIH
jgi:DNA repair photolyase